MKYLLTGDTYPVKEELKAHGCFWNPDQCAWETQDFREKGDLRKKNLKELCKGLVIEMNPLQLHPEAQTIQDILNPK